TPWTTTQEACRTMGGGRGKVGIGWTNRLGMTGDGLGLGVGYTTSGGEMVAGWCPGAFVYKSFNQTGFEIMADPTRFQPRPVMFVAGDDAAHKPTVLQLVRDVGFEARDAGPLASARLLEPYAMGWIDQGLKRGADPALAFALAPPLVLGGVVLVTALPRAVREVENIFIPLQDGTRLSARLWLPADAEQDPVPALLEYLPYRKRDGTVERDSLTHPYLAGHGYACVRVDIRGSGES